MPYIFPFELLKGDHNLFIRISSEKRELFCTNSYIRSVIFYRFFYLLFKIGMYFRVLHVHISDRGEKNKKGAFELHI